MKPKNTKNPIRGYFTPNNNQHKDCCTVIAQLNFIDLSREPRTLHTKDNVHLDMQGHLKNGDANLQVQIDGQTVAAAIIADSMLKTKDPDNRRGAANGAISALNQSLDSGTIWKLDGSLP